MREREAKNNIKKEIKSSATAAIATKRIQLVLFFRL